PLIDILRTEFEFGWLDQPLRRGRAARDGLLDEGPRLRNHNVEHQPFAVVEYLPAENLLHPLIHSGHIVSAGIRIIEAVQSFLFKLTHLSKRNLPAYPLRDLRGGTRGHLTAVIRCLPRSLSLRAGNRRIRSSLKLQHRSVRRRECVAGLEIPFRRNGV